MSQATFDPQTQARLRRRRIIISVIVVSIAVHFIGAILAGIWIVARFILATPTTFEVKKQIRIAAEEREHRMNMAEFDAARPKPSFTDKMSTARPTEFSLPDLPTLPIDTAVDIDPSDIVSDQLAALAGAGAGSGSGSGGGGKGGSAVNFLGLSGTGQRVVLIFDVSTTVANALAKAGAPLTVIKDKVKELLGSLGINTTFGIAQFSRQYAFFKTELVPASESNRTQAQAWLDQWFSTGRGLKSNTPNLVREKVGFLGVLTEAFKLKPDLIYIVGDGSFQRGEDRGESIPFKEINSTLRDLQKTLPQPATVNFIGVGMREDDLKEIRRIISSQGGAGRFKELATER
jgi:hypothetical protein